MSRIYFHSQSGEAQLRGSERGHMSILCSDALISAIGPILDYDGHPSWVRNIIPPGCYLHSSSNLRRDLPTYLCVGEANIVLGDSIHSGWQIGLNTALVVGGDALKLCARLHGQCEIHCYVLGGNREWLARIIRAGRKTGVLRANEGWEGVVEFLESNSVEPVVCSYSVSMPFPNPYIVNPEATEEEAEVWYELSDAEKWSSAFETLVPSLEISPLTWQDYYFGEGINGFQLQELASQAGKAS